MAPTPTVVLVPLWAPGHLSSTLEAGKRLLRCCTGGSAFSLTVLLVPPPLDSDASDITGQIDREIASNDHALISFHGLPAVDHSPDPIHPSVYVELFAGHVKDAVAGLTAPVAAIVVDWFGTMLLDVARELAVPGYVYFTATGALLSLMLRLPAVLDEVAATLRDSTRDRVVDVPGLPPVPAKSMPSPVQNEYPWFAYHGRRFTEAQGIIVNTAAELEPGVLQAITDGRCTPGIPAPTLYPIGPVLSLKQPSADENKHECIAWLDAQPPASVVFLCFGSRGWMSREQTREVAHGLDCSGHRFLWVLRSSPANEGSLYPTDADLDALLPDGFLHRTKGLVWPRWAPQQEILAHSAVGGFVTHCGWNSVLESLWFGVPMAPWPLYAEQPLNAFELVACMGVALELKICTGSNSVEVEAAEMERTVRSLMGGDEAGRKVRQKAAEMKVACRNAVEKGGSSYNAMQKLAHDMLASLPDATHRVN